MALEAIGTIACPVCGWHHGAVKQTKSELAMIYCDSCGTQVFCRTPKGDKLIRGRMVAIAPAGDPPPSNPKPTDPTPARPPKARGSFLDDL
jgi:hypothetical protein